MTVWIVTHNWGYDGGSTVVKVFAFESQAKAYVDAQVQTYSSSYDYEEFVVESE